jgi:ribosomal-protein-alanine N-acetyltransferase
MLLEDVPQAAAIERESFPPPWPPTNFKRDLTSNSLTSYLVACDTLTGTGLLASADIDSVGIEDGGRPESRGLVAGLRRVMRLSPAAAAPEEPILGFMGVWFMVDEAHVSSIAVRVSHRRMGVGEHLVLAGLDLAIDRNAEFMTLEVRASNAAAVALYAKCGFTEVGRRKGYYSDNKEDAVLMTAEGIGAPRFREYLEKLKVDHARRWDIAV